MATPVVPGGPARKDNKEPRDVVDNTSFPEPSLFFKVYDSEKDEPESKCTQDVLKLYDRWLAKYGRRWPENGLNTEDLVWLNEEAYKSPGAPGAASASGVPGSVAIPAEDSEVTDHVNTTDDENMALDAADAKAASKMPPGASFAAGSTADGMVGVDGRRARRPKLSNYEKTLAGGNWVTDEFESENYEAGNMEQLWDMYLWDREGKPTIMPDDPPVPEEGEESEAWDDFYSSYRPRHIDSEEARQAVWVTDEFESDEDNTESEWEPEYVGAGLGLKVEDPFNPQYSLRHSNHPLAPFPGEALKWSSFMYDDGTSYEGITREDIFHGMGVLVFGNGTGGGFHFRDVRRGDKYEGEFQGGYAHGLGQFTSESRGEIYIGEFFAGQRHGCGLKVDMKPYWYLVERGIDPIQAYHTTSEQIMRNIEFRTWYRNKPLGSDYEDEVVLHPAYEDLGNPWDVVLRNNEHERKLREWKGMTDKEKVASKMQGIIESVNEDRANRREGNMGPGKGDAGYFTRDHKGVLHPALGSCGDSTEHDSMDLIVGREADGMPGPGWMDDPQADMLTYNIWDPKMEEQAAGEAEEDKDEENDDKQAVLGDDILNPLTGLTLKEYLDGEESKHRELIVKAFGDDPQYAGYKQEYGFMRGVEEGDEPPAPRSGGRRGGGILSAIGGLFGLGGGRSKDLGMVDAYVLEQKFNEAEKEYGEHSPFAKPSRYDNKNPWSEETDTRFETESDQMELCDLAEILGTVDEATEIVTRARMWRWKPNGEVTFRTAVDANGSPLNLMQDPLHYPHGTKFMAPGPLGQCHPIPDDRALRDMMRKVMHNYEYIHSLYNFDWDPEPGTAQFAINQRLDRASELEQQQIGRMARLADHLDGLEDSGDGEGELLASLPTGETSGAGAAGKHLLVREGTVFASMSFGMSRASRAIWDTLAKAAKNHGLAHSRGAQRSNGGRSSSRAAGSSSSRAAGSSRR